MISLSYKLVDRYLLFVNFMTTSFLKIALTGLSICSLATTVNSQIKYLIPTQDTAYPLFTAIDTNQLKEYDKIFDFKTFIEDTTNLAKLYALRKELESHAMQGDPLGELLYAKTFDLYEYGMGNPDDAKIALEYYSKSAARNLAEAEIFLFRLYRYGFMNVKVDISKSLNYLNNAVEHGNASIKSTGYKELASIFYNAEDIPGIKADTTKTIVYLQKAIQYNPADARAMDFLGSIYADEQLFDQALVWKLKTDNRSMNVEAAEWLIEGKKVKKDVEKGLRILYNLAELFTEEENGCGADCDPIYILNKLYHWDHLISREQVGKYYEPNFIPPGG